MDDIEISIDTHVKFQLPSKSGSCEAKRSLVFPRVYIFTAKKNITYNKCFFIFLYP